MRLGSIISFRAEVKLQTLEFIEVVVHLFHDIQKHKSGMTLLELTMYYDQ